jgi:hypothetical protein
MVYNFRYVQVESFDTCGLCCVGYQTILFVSVDVVMRALFIKPGHKALCLKYNLSNVLFMIIYYSLQNFAIWYNICITICLFFLVLGRNI